MRPRPRSSPNYVVLFAVIFFGVLALACLGCFALGTYGAVQGSQITPGPVFSPTPVR